MPGVGVRRLWLVVVPVLLASCSAAVGKSPLAGSKGTPASDGGAAAADGSGHATDFGNAPDMSMTAAGRGDASAARKLPADCAGQTQRAAQVQVDMYVMLDRSGSMRAMTGAGATKWDAIRQALSNFVQDAKSSGLGVGLQYFPLGAPGVPESCSADIDCGAQGGPCTTKACKPPPTAQSFPFTQCVTNADCPTASPGCATFGMCELDNTLACFGIGPNGCQAQGACVPVQGECLGYASCAVADYETPAVPIATLPDNAAAVIASLDAEQPIGLTPTPAALQGALRHAAVHAQQNPSHRVIVLLATDGFPTQCLPASAQTVDQAVDAVAQIAAKGFAMQPSIETYVIGVFGPDDPNAMSQLDRLAVAGGTDHALVVDTSRDVAQQLLDVLATIRHGTLACDFELPAAPQGQTLDFNLVNVELTQGIDTSELLYVGRPDQCDKADLGWFYDVDPGSGQTPTKISACPHTCDALRAAQDAAVDIRLGCATKGPI
jgi:Mg-chelatase subunit ChlD